MKKIAIFHNFLDNIGGAEIVDLMLARELGADVYTTNIDSDKIKKMGFEDVLPRIFSIGKVPINAPFKQEFSYWKFRRLNLGKKYDFYIIAGDWAMSGAVKNRPNLWYVYSPTRELWDSYKFVRKRVPFYLRKFFDLWVLYRRWFNKKDVESVEKIICISNVVSDRVKKFLGKESIVVYPPVDTGKFKFVGNGEYWLSVNRLFHHKRIDIQIEAFRKMKEEKLIIVGSYENSRHFIKYASWVHKNKPNNVEIKSWVSDDELIKLYSRCKGFITTSKEEDFGLTAVEAMASGKPVIAPNEGGYKESLIDGKTGILIDEIDSDKIIEAVRKINMNLEKNKNKYRFGCEKRAKDFDLKIFIKKIKEEIYGKS